MKQLFSEKFNFLFFLLGLCLFVYLILRSVFVPILHDEVSTFYIYIESGNFLPWKAWPDANNHFLNSLLGWLMFKLLGSEVWVMRLPNVLSAVVYFFAVVGISRSIRNKYLSVLFVLVMFLTHGMIEFFAYARGYGLSMAFLLLSIWMILLAEKKNNIKFATYALLAMIPALMANLNLLPSAGIIMVYMFMFAIKFFRNIHWRKWLFFAFAFILLVLTFTYAAHYSILLKNKDLLYYGGETGFYNAILKTHAKMLFFNTGNFLLLIVLCIFTVSLGAFVKYFIPKQIKNTFRPTVTLFSVLFMGSLLAVLFLHHVLKVNYPEDRTSLFLYPYFVGFVFFIADQYGKKMFRWIVVPFIYVPLNFLVNANMSYSFHWHYERIPPNFPELVSDASQHHSPGNVTISGYKILELIWGHNVRFNASGVNLMNPANYPNNIDDFVLLRKEERDTMNTFFAEYVILAEDPYSHIQLLKRKTPSTRKLLFESVAVREPLKMTGEYLNFFPDTLFDFAGKSLLFQFDAQFDSPKGTDGCVIVVSVRDSLNNNLQYQRIETAWLSDNPVHDFSYSLSVLHIPENAAGLIAYIWNKNKRELSLSYAKASVFEFGNSSVPQ